VPPADAGPGTLVVWRLGDALLAVPLDAVEEVVAVGGDRQARGREVVLDVVDPPGLPPHESPRHAVIIRAVGTARRVALAADQVEGVRDPSDAPALDPPPWLAALASVHTRTLVRLDDRRVAALLDVAALLGDP